MAAMAHAAETVTREQTIPAGVDQVTIETPGDLHIVPGAQARLSVEAEPHVHEKLDNAIGQGTLTLRAKGGFNTQRALRYVLTIPHLRALTVRGSGDANVGAFRGEKLVVEVVGSGDSVLEGIEFKNLTLRISGSGDVSARGHGEELDASIDGSGSVRAQNYAVARARAKVVGSGDIDVNASGRLDATVGGSGDIRYKGSPSVTRNVSGSGSVEPL